MTNARIHIQWQYRTACLLVSAILFACPAQAQLSLKRQKYDSIAARYKNEHAVYTDVKHRIQITPENGGLSAYSTGSAEKLFISDASLNAYNTDDVSLSSFSYFTHRDAMAYLPEGNDYRRVMNRDADGNVSLTYSGIKKNTLTRSVYSIAHEEIRLLPWFFFGENIPVLNSAFEVVAPKYVRMGFLLKGADTSHIRRTVVESGGKVIYRFTATNMPANRHFGNVPSELYYQPHVIPYVISYRLTGAKKDSILTGTTGDHHKFEYKYVKGLNFKTDSFLTKKTAELTKKAYSEKDKAQRIYDWVQQNFHYLEIFRNEMEGLVPNPADTVCKRMYGDCKDMSSIIMAMCQKAGIEAYFTAIGTDEKPYTHDELQSEYLYNHMICAVKLNGDWVFLDGTTHVQPMGKDRPDIQGKEAMIMMNDHDYKVVKIPEMPASSNVVVNKTVMNLSYNDVTGTTYLQYSGYPAWDAAEELAYMNRKNEKDEFVRALSMRGNNNFVLKGYDVNVEKTGNKDVTITTDYKLGDYAQLIKRNYYVNMNLTRTFTDLQMTDTGRNVAMHLHCKKTVKETVVLNIPRGYHVSHVPKGVKGGVAGLWSYNIAYKVNNRNHTITLTRDYVLNTMNIEPAQFAANNKLVEQLKKQYKETVVLTAN